MGKIKKWFNDISIRKSFMIYMLFFMILAAVLSGVMLKTIDIIIEDIHSSYSSKVAERYYLTTKDGKQLGNGAGIIEKYEEPKYSIQDERKLFVLKLFQSIITPLTFVLCTGGAAILFYRNKLHIPLTTLNMASEKIAADNLDFFVDYSSKDEMGKLCISFEKMRSTLEENNREMWRSMEERKRLNAAFAHDLRTPLTVLRGYAEFLLNNFAEDKLSKEKVISTVYTMTNQIDRLESYVQNVNGLQKLEEIKPQTKEVALFDILEAFREISNIICQHKKVGFAILKQETEKTSIDLDLVLQVFENLMSNAVRYAENQIDIVIAANDNVLKVTVSDDGQGFGKEAIKKATDPFYRANHKGDGLHLGLGLHICKIICEKHGGQLLLSNGSDKGAVITATFHSSKAY